MEIIQQPLTIELKNKIYSGFKEHAVQATGQNSIGDSVAFVAMENNECIGAVVVHPFWGALHIKYVWVEEAHRGKKIGTTLMQKAYDYGSTLNCPFAFVETMSFQALGFYQKLGFTLEFTRDGYVNGLAFHYLKKNFLKAITDSSLKQPIMSRVGVYGIAFQGENLLVVKQKKGPHQGKFDLPGGKIEFGETIEEALQREFLEEVGMTFKTMQLLDNFTANTTAKNNDGHSYCLHQLGLIYAVEHLSSAPNASPEMDYLWIPLKHLSETLVSPLLWQALSLEHCLKKNINYISEGYDSSSI